MLDSAEGNKNNITQTTLDKYMGKVHSYCICIPETLENFQKVTHCVLFIFSAPMHLNI